MWNKIAKFLFTPLNFKKEDPRLTKYKEDWMKQHGPNFLSYKYTRYRGREVVWDVWFNPINYDQKTGEWSGEVEVHAQAYPKENKFSISYVYNEGTKTVSVR